MGREGCVAGMIIARSCPGRAPLGEGEGRCHPTRCICTDSKHIKGVSDDIPQSQTHISREEIPFPAHHPNMPSFNATCYARFTHPPKEGGKSKNKKKEKKKRGKNPISRITPPIPPPGPPPLLPPTTIELSLAQLDIHRIMRLAHPAAKLLTVADPRRIPIFLHPGPEVVGADPARIEFRE